MQPPTPASSVSSVKVLVVIPLRLASTRIPKKVMAPIGQLSLSQRTVGRTLDIFKDDPRVAVLAAVDSPETAAHLQKKFGNTLHTIVTDPEIPSGTDRVAVASSEFVKQHPEVALRGILNVQGDVPFIGADGLRAIADYYASGSKESLARAGMSTLAQSWPVKEQDYAEPAAVKVIPDREGLAIYFSRHPIPHSKISAREALKNAGRVLGQLHIGVYGYTPDILARICAHAPTDLELNEGLEQLRALWLGIRILVISTEPAAGESYRGIDTPRDLSWARTFAKTGGRLARKAIARKTALKKTPVRKPAKKRSPKRKKKR